MERPSGVSAIAAIFLAAAAYLLALGAVMAVRPGTVSMMLGSPLMGGLELAGPYMFLLLGALGTVVGWGLLRLWNWARRAATLIAIAGVALLIPAVSSAVADFRLIPLIEGAVGVMVRVVIAWYLYQGPVAEAFRAGKSN